MYKVEKDYLFVPHLGNLRKGDVITKEQADTYNNFQVLLDENQVSITEGVVSEKLSKKEQKKADKEADTKDAREFVADDDEL